MENFTTWNPFSVSNRRNDDDTLISKERSTERSSRDIILTNNHPGRSHISTANIVLTFWCSIKGFLSPPPSPWWNLRLSHVTCHSSCTEWLGDNTWAAWWEAKWISNRPAIFTQSYQLAIDVLLLTTCCVTIWKIFCKCTRTLFPKKTRKRNYYFLRRQTSITQWLTQHSIIILCY
jgi:hypothetical protein